MKGAERLLCVDGHQFQICVPRPYADLSGAYGTNDHEWIANAINSICLRYEMDVISGGAKSILKIWAPVGENKM